jgi:DNA processing protein
MHSELFYQIALTLVPRIGPVHAKLLTEHFESASAVFKAARKALGQLEGMGEVKARNIKEFDDFKRVETEIRFIEKHQINTYFLTDKAYPQRLLNCYDPPCLLYGKGEANLNHPKIVAVIGTRNHSVYGRQQTEKLVEELKPYNVLVLSGLALGIDAMAHKTAVKHQIPTVGIMANGIDKIYPSEHAPLIRDMINNGGGILTELLSGTQADKHFFPARNRIVAGMADVVVVVETGKKGGSMITAELANGYHKDVMAMPGRVTDPKSEGCNHLIQTNKAQLINSAAELVQFMRWEESQKQTPKKQRELFLNLSEDENKILSLISSGGQKHIDEIYLKSGCSSSTVAGALLMLELQHLVRLLPGKLYESI